jgi:hypothetical protein
MRWEPRFAPRQVHRDSAGRFDIRFTTSIIDSREAHLGTTGMFDLSPSARSTRRGRAALLRGNDGERVDSRVHL